MHDVRHALRSLRDRPGFTTVAVLTLALGIGVNITLFSLVSAFFLQPLPVAEPGRLAMILQRTDVVSLAVGYSYANIRDIRDGATVFSGR